MPSTALPVAEPTPVGAGRVHLTATVSGVAFGLTAPLTVVYATALGAGGLLAGAAVSSMSVSVLLVDLFGSRFVPRLEPRRALAVALVVFGAGSLMSALAPNLAVMITARCFQGIGAALFQGSGPMLAVRVGGKGNEGRALGQFQAAWFLGIAIGPLAGAGLAGTVPGTSGLRIAFAACAAVSLIGAGVVLRLLPRMPTGLRPVIGRPRLGGLAAPRPVLALAIGGCGQAVRSGLAMTLLPLIVTGHLGLTGLALGTVLSIFAVSDVTAMYTGGHLSDRIGRLPVLVGALLVGSVLTLVGATIDTPVPFALVCIGLGIPVGIAWVVPAAMAVDLADDPVSGLVGYRIGADIGLGVGGVLAGAAVTGLGTTGALRAAAAALVVPVLLALVVGETRRSRALHPLVTAADLVSVTALGGPMTPAPLRPLEGSTAMTAESDSESPTVDDYRRVAADQGLHFRPDRYPAALATHAALRPALTRLRQIPIPFLQGTEPASALAWIENGGTR